MGTRAVAVVTTGWHLYLSDPRTISGHQDGINISIERLYVSDLQRHLFVHLEGDHHKMFVSFTCAQITDAERPMRISRCREFNILILSPPFRTHWCDKSVCLDTP